MRCSYRSFIDFKGTPFTISLHKRVVQYYYAEKHEDIKRLKMDLLSGTVVSSATMKCISLKLNDAFVHSKKMFKNKHVLIKLNH